VQGPTRRSCPLIPALKHTPSHLLTTLLLAPLAALQAAESQSASPAKPPAVDQRSAFQQTESKPQTGTSDSSEALATPAIKKPSGTPLAPISDPGPEFADEKRLQSQQPSGLVWGELEKH
jgi:hypothetical protein